MSEKSENVASENTRESHFKGDLHKAIDAAQTARRQASRSYMQRREELLEQARTMGSETPERDVARVQAAILKEIDRKEHRDVHAVFEKYGWEREKRQVNFDREAEEQQTKVQSRRRRSRSPVQDQEHDWE